MTKRAIINLIISAVIVAAYFTWWLLQPDDGGCADLGPFFMVSIAGIYSIITSIILLALLVRHKKLYNNIFFLTSWFANIGLSYYAFSLLADFLHSKNDSGFMVFLLPLILAIIQTIVFFKINRKLKKGHNGLGVEK